MNLTEKKKNFYLAVFKKKKKINLKEKILKMILLR